jgi:hypothetical protein
LVGFFCGIGNYVLAVIATLCIASILMLKYVRVKILKNGDK